MDLIGSFESNMARPPAKLADLAYIKTERAAAHEAPVLIDFVTRWMTERDYKIGLACLDLLLEKKCNINGGKKTLTRQDGHTPSVIHELSQALYTIALVEAGYPLPDAEIVMCLNFTHDLGEEFDISKHGLVQHLDKHDVIYARRIRLFSDMFENMTKSRRGAAKYENNVEYFETMLEHPATVIAKFQDRIHNMATLIGVKTLAKHKEYIVETMALRDTLNQAAILYPAYARTFKAMNDIVVAQLFFNSQFLDKMDPANPVKLTFDNLPRLNKMVPLPAGLDPLQILQTRALEKITKAISVRQPSPDSPV